jgi:hypothetical protein
MRRLVQPITRGVYSADRHTPCSSVVKKTAVTTVLPPKLISTYSWKLPMRPRVAFWLEPTSGCAFVSVDWLVLRTALARMLRIEKQKLDTAASRMPAALHCSRAEVQRKIPKIIGKMAAYWRKLRRWPSTIKSKTHVKRGSAEFMQ